MTGIQRGTRVASDLTVTSLHAEATRRSEQVTDVLLGEALEVVDRAGDVSDAWLRVKGPDGYAGWLPESHVAVLGDSWADVVTVEALSATVRRADGAPLCPVVFGCRLATVSADSSGERDVALPRGVIGRLPAEAFAPFYGDRAEGAAHVISSMSTALAGIPYRWGGRSVWGFDCSGLVQLVLGQLGVSLPRDSYLMEAHLAASAERVASDDRRVGDVIFWGSPSRATHVGIALDRERFLHARQWVRVGRWSSGRDADLAVKVRGVFRLPEITGS